MRLTVKYIVHRLFGPIIFPIEIAHQQRANFPLSDIESGGFAIFEDGRCVSVYGECVSVPGVYFKEGDHHLINDLLFVGHKKYFCLSNKEIREIPSTRENLI